MPQVGTIEEPILEPFELQRDRERIRSILAIILVALIVCEIFGIGIVGAWTILVPKDAMPAEKAISAIKDIAVLVLPPSIALASAVMGFYYASKNE
jgi:hypothetical protein